MKALLLFLVALATPAFAGEIVSSGQPDRDDIERYANDGVTTVIDLRGVAEERGFDEADAVEAAGMRYLSLPIEGREGVSFENARRLDALLAGADGPVLVHCASGNRVGALMALRASLAGADKDEALATGRAFGLSGLTALVERRLEEAASHAEASEEDSQ